MGRAKARPCFASIEPFYLRMKDRFLIVVGLFALMAFGTYQRTEVWNDPLTLWRSASALAPKHARPRLNIAHFLIEQRNYDAAKNEYFRIMRDVQIDRAPLYQSNARNAALTNLGLLDAVQGQYLESERYLNLVIAEWPDQPYPRINRGMAYLAMNRCSEARQDFSLAGVRPPLCR